MSESLPHADNTEVKASQSFSALVMPGVDRMTISGFRAIF